MANHKTITSNPIYKANGQQVEAALVKILLHFVSLILQRRFLNIQSICGCRN